MLHEQGDAAPRRSRLYTRTGDAGRTSLRTGARVLKTSPIIAALGEVDTLNCHVGMLLNALESAPGLEADDRRTHRDRLTWMQHRLLDLGSVVSMPHHWTDDEPKGHPKEEADAFDVHVLTVERYIDETDAALPPLRNFILPGGDKDGAAACWAHMARAQARRAEVALLNADPEMITRRKWAAAFMNRLSDYFFVSARMFAHAAGETDRIHRGAVVSPTGTNP